MVQLHAFRRSLRVACLCVMALATGSMAIVASASPASARTHHRFRRHTRTHFAGRYLAYRHYRHITRRSRRDAGVAQMRSRGFANANANIGETGFAPNAGGVTTTSSFGSSGIVSEARRFLGGNPTSRRSLWCARFMNLVLQHSGYKGTGSDMAASFAHYGQRVAGPQVGAIAVMRRRGGGHVGIITGIDASGNPIMISGNNRNRVREAPVSRGRIYAYVMPTG
jgi:uncharacterized protein (TIGR02594 family)